MLLRNESGGCRCRNPNNPALFKITAGEWDRLKDEHHEQVYNGSFVHRHPSFKKDGDLNDIALVRLNGSFNFTPWVQPACFPTANASFGASSDCVVSGWGTFEAGAKYNGSSSQFLKYEKVFLWDQKECNDSKSQYEG